jgi:hypothetical protein
MVLGKTDLVQHKIDTGDAVSFKMQPRRLPLAKREAIKTEIDRLLNDGIIEPPPRVSRESLISGKGYESFLVTSFNFR